MIKNYLLYFGQNMHLTSHLIRYIAFTSESEGWRYRQREAAERCRSVMSPHPVPGVGQWLEMSDYLLFYDKIVQNWIIFAVIDHQMPPNASAKGSQLRVHKNLYLWSSANFSEIAIFSENHTIAQILSTLVTISSSDFFRKWLWSLPILPPEVLSLM